MERRFDGDFSIDELSTHGDNGIGTLNALDGELLARLTATGTHAGPFLGVAPSGQRVSIAAFEAWRLRDGQCAEQWLHLDILGLLQQLGAAPPVEPISSLKETVAIVMRITNCVLRCQTIEARPSKFRNKSQFSIVLSGFEARF